MAVINRFQDLQVWNLARTLENRVFEITQLGKLSNDFSLRNQLNKSTGSVMDNIAEGFGRSGRTEFIQFLSISKGSVTELQSQLYRCFDRGYISDSVLNELLELCNKTIGKLVNLMKYLNNSYVKGEKFLGRDNHLK